MTVSKYSEGHIFLKTVFRGPIVAAFQFQTVKRCWVTPKNFFLIILQLSETSADDRGISARIGKPWTTGGDVPVDRLMWQAVCVVGRRLAGSQSNNNNNNNNKNNTCLPVIEKIT